MKAFTTLFILVITLIVIIFLSIYADEARAATYCPSVDIMTLTKTSMEDISCQILNKPENKNSIIIVQKNEPMYSIDAGKINKVYISKFKKRTIIQVGNELIETDGSVTISKNSGSGWKF